MPAYRHQAVIDAPLQVVYDLVSDVANHSSWFPRVVDAECDEVAQGCTFKQVIKQPLGGRLQTTLAIERLENCQEVHIRCLDTGTSARWVMTGAQGGTFVEFEFGQDPPLRTMDKIADHMGARRYFRRWGEQSLDALRVAAERRAPSAA